MHHIAPDVGRVKPRHASVLCLHPGGFHRMHYCDWGEQDNVRILLCVHGLTRNARDFDDLARALSGDFRVVCPDIVGRGRSDWLPLKDQYSYAQYLADVSVLLGRVTAHVHAPEICWLGTSMGALLGITAAALGHNPIAKLVLNDAGMRVPEAALARLATYVGREPRFNSLEQAESHLRQVCAPFGPLTAAQWRHLTRHGVQEHADGTWTTRYDPAIGHALQGPLGDVDLSALWDVVACPTLILRGAESDVLLRETALAMTQSGPKATLVEFQGIGHAPMLMDPEQVGVVHDFLLRR